MSNSMTFEREGDYIVCYINGKEVSRAKVKSAGADEQEIIDVINDQIKVNPTLAGTEPNLTGLQMGDDKYANPEGTIVVANPTVSQDDATLTSLKIDDTNYKLPQLYEIKVSFGDDLVELVCLSNHPINNIENITNSTVITNDMWLNLLELRHNIFNTHLRTGSNTALLSAGYMSFVIAYGQVVSLSIKTFIYYPDAGTQTYTASGKEENSISIQKEGSNYYVVCTGNRTPRSITCTRIL